MVDTTVLLTLVLLGIVAYQQLQIGSLKTEVQTYASTTNLTQVSDKVNAALRATTTFSEDLMRAQQNLTKDFTTLKTLSSNVSGLPVTTAEFKVLQQTVEEEAHTIVENRAYIDSFINMIAGIFVVFTIIIAAYHIKLHDDNLKEIKYKHQNWKDEDYYQFCQNEEGNLSPIIILPPIYAIASLFSIIFPGSAFAGGFTDFAEIMQSISIWYFVKTLDHTMRYIANEYPDKLVLSDDMYDSSVLSQEDIDVDKKLVALLAYYFEKSRLERERKALTAGKKGLVCLGFAVDFSHLFEDTNAMVDNVKWCVYDFGCMVITCDKLSSCLEFGKQAAFREGRGYEEVCCASVEESPDVRRAKAWLLHSTVYTRQFVVLRFFLAVFHLLFFTTNYILQLPPYIEDNFNIFIIAVDVIIMTLAFWAVEQFLIDGPKDILVDNRPEKKCFIFQVLVVYTFFQEIFITVLVYTLNHCHYDVGIDAETINNFFVCTEMFIISILHLQVYPTDEWQEGYLERSREQRKIEEMGVVSSLASFYEQAPILSDVNQGVEMVKGIFGKGDDESTDAKNK